MKLFTILLLPALLAAPSMAQNARGHDGAPPVRRRRRSLIQALTSEEKDAAAAAAEKERASRQRTLRRFTSEFGEDLEMEAEALDMADLEWGRLLQDMSMSVPRKSEPAETEPSQRMSMLSKSKVRRRRLLPLLSTSDSMPAVLTVIKMTVQLYLRSCARLGQFLELLLCPCVCDVRDLIWLLLKAVCLTCMP